MTLPPITGMILAAGFGTRLRPLTLELPKPRFVTCGGQGRVYIASSNLVWVLTMVPVSEQVPQLIRDKQFELACTLGKLRKYFCLLDGLY